MDGAPCITIQCTSRPCAPPTSVVAPVASHETEPFELSTLVHDIFEFSFYNAKARSPKESGAFTCHRSPRALGARHFPRLPLEYTGAPEDIRCNERGLMG